MSDENTPSDTPNSAERIAKVIARSGVASRRDAEKMILAGRVTVNGKPVTTPALDVAPSDKVVIDGKPIDAPQETRVWLYYKPLGLVTTEKDEQGRRTIFDEMPEGMPRVLNIGRLDLNSEGLLLLTNDGGLKRRLELPETGWLRKYRVRVNGRPNEATFDPLRRGITIEGEEFQPMEISLDRQQGANAWLTVGIREGKNREIRRAMAEIGLTVNRLIRVSYGPFRLNEMQPGDVVEVKRKLLRDQLGDRLLTGAEDGRPPRAERMAPKAPRRRDEGEAGGKPAFEKKPFAKKPFERDDDGKRGFGRQRDFSEGAEPGARKPRAFGSKSHRDESGEKRIFTRRDGDEGKRPFQRRDGDEGGKRPYVRRDGDEGGKRPFARREDGEGKRPYVRRDGDEGGKRPFQRREDGEGKRPYVRRDGDEGGKRPFPRREDGEGKRPYVRRDGDEGGKRPFPRREDGEGKRPYVRRDGDEGGKRPFPRREDGEGKRPYVRRDGDEGGKRPYARREDGEGKRPYARRDGDEGGKRPYTPRPPREGDEERRPQRSFDKPRSYDKPREGFEKPRSYDKPRPAEGDRAPREGGFGARSGGGFGSKGPRSEGGKPGFKSAGFKSHGGKPGSKPRAEGFKSHSGKPVTGAGRPPRSGDGKPGPKRG